MATPGDRRAWLVLSAMFGLLAIDESCSLHELLSEPARHALQLGGALRFAWVLPAVAAVILFLVAFSRFWWRQDRHTRLLLATAAAAFLSGAVGVGMVASTLWAACEAQTLVYRLSTAVEEFLEMAGTPLYVYSTWRLLAQRIGRMALVLRAAMTTADDAPRAMVVGRAGRAWRDAATARRLPAPDAGG